MNDILARGWETKFASELDDWNWQVLSEAVASLEASWAGGEPPSMARFVPSRNTPLRHRALIELIKVDQEFRFATGHVCFLEDYLSQWPELKPSSSALGELLAAECLTRAIHDRLPTAEELRERFPAIANTIDLDAIGRQALEEQSRMATPPNLLEPTDTLAGEAEGQKGVMPSGHVPRLAATRRLGRYEIRALLGQGAMASVYRAWDPTLGREVALKIPQAEALADPSLMQRFLLESRAAAAISHTHVCPVYDAARVDGTAYLAMALVEGEPLDKWVIRRTITPSQAADLISKLARALDAVHAAGIIHRDVKPSNVMIDEEGEPVLTDFGLARYLQNEHRLTRTGSAIGTPAYMAPEQVRGDQKQIDARADVFSLGVMLFELLTGERPFRGTHQMVLLQILQDEPPHPRKLHDGVPRDLETICLKALAKEQHRRYETAGKMADDLQRWADNKPILARPVTPLGRLGRWSRRNRAVAALLLTVAAVSAVSFGFITWSWQVALEARAEAEWQLDEVTRQRDTARRERERANRNFLWARTAVEETMTRLLDHPHFRHADEFRDLHSDLLVSAISFYEDLVQQEYEDPLLEADRGRAYWRLGVVRSLMGNERGSLEDFQHMGAIFADLVAQYPDNAEYRFLWGWSLGWQARLSNELGRPQQAVSLSSQAIALLKQVIAANPDDALAVAKLGACYAYRGVFAEELGEPDVALQWYDRAIEHLAPPLPVPDEEAERDRRYFLAFAHHRTADSHIGAGQWGLAVTYLERLIELEPDEPNWWYELALAQWGKGDRDAGRQVCAQMLDRFYGTDRPEVANRVAYTCVPFPEAVSDTERLVALAELAATLGEGNARIAGAARYRHGDYRGALQLFEQTAAVQPLGAWDLMFLSLIHVRLDNPDEARDYFDRGLAWIEKAESGEHDWPWTEQVEFDHLRQEARTSIENTRAPSYHTHSRR